MPKLRKVLALDTEDNSEGQVSIINFYDGLNHVSFRGEDLQLNAWNWLGVQGPCYVWACNVEYDLINLFGVWVGKMVTLNYGGAGLVRATWQDAPVVFLDTLRHWPMSVDQMGRYLGLTKLDRIHKHCAGAERCRRCLRYCERDTEIVWDFVDHMLRRYEDMGLQLKATLPSMALQLFQKKFYKQEWISVAKRERDFFRRGYYGGRVEVYHFGQIKGPIHHYDVNSLFPSVMKHGRYPDLQSGWTYTQAPNWKNEGMADCTILVPECRYPPLPVRVDEESLVYPHGLLRGVWAYPEIRAAIERGAKVLEVYDAIEYQPLRRSPFAGYVDFCYERRRKSAHDLDKVFWKLMMNSLYGKFGQSENFTIIHNDTERGLGSPAKHANVIWAAYVTSLARVRLLQLLESTTTCYYTDTDSLFTPDRLPTSPKLGELKWEGTAKKTRFYGNKLYVMWDYDCECGQCKGNGKDDGVASCNKCHGAGKLNRKEVMKVKGIPASAAGDFIRTGRAIYRKPVRYRESRHSFADANVWMSVEKIRDDLYTKRQVFGDGSTRAWSMSAYQKEEHFAQTEGGKLGKPGARPTHHGDGTQVSGV